MDKTPFEYWHGRKPIYTNLNRFGGQTVKILDENRRKLELKALKRILLAVDMELKTYKVYVPNSKKVLISRDVKFIEAKKTVNHDNAIEIPSDDGFAVQNTLKDEDKYRV